MPLKLYSLKLKNLVPAEDNIFFNTYEGDMIKLDLKLKKQWSKNSFICKYDARRIKNIVQLRDNLTSLTIVERVRSQTRDILDYLERRKGTFYRRRCSDSLWAKHGYT